MSIILRVNKGAALTYDEMDRNQSQFYYSSSLHSSGARLRLHYTGSATLTTGGEDYSPRYTEITFPTTDTTGVEATAAGGNKQIQFNDGGVFGGRSVFVFDSTTNSQGIGTGTPLAKLDIHAESTRGAIIVLRGSTTGTGEGRNAQVSFNVGSTSVGKIGKIVSDNINDLFFTNNRILAGDNYGKLNFSIGEDSNIIGGFSYDGNEKKFGVGTNTPSRQISLVGSKGLGVSLAGAPDQDSYLTPIPSAILNAEVGGIRKLIPPSSEPAGLLISSPNSTEGGNVVVAINTDSNLKEGFNIIKSTQGVYTSSEVIASFQVSGKVGINTNTPSDVGLTVAGIISGSGNLEIDGTAKIDTIATGAANSTSALVATSAGLIQKIDAAPVPKGGIIMWSGTILEIPNGWFLCNGANGTPNLRDRFIVGAGSTYAVGATGGSADAVVVSHTHTVAESGAHTHIYKDTIFSESSNAAGDATYIDNKDQIIGTTGRHTSTTVSGQVWSYNENRTIASSGAHTHTIGTTGESGTNKNLPPYYALAYIMYGGI